MLTVGFIGWRGMVGSVLLQRMREESDWDFLDCYFFSTSNAGGAPPPEAGHKVLKDAYDIGELAKCAVLVSCQGGDYTSRVYGPLRQSGWTGYWIDAASTLRMEKDSVLLLDPVNLAMIEEGLHAGVKAYIGPNCTISLMLMGLAGLFQHNLVEWITSMTYQAASGAGAAKMLELVRQMGVLAGKAGSTNDALLADRLVTAEQRHPDFPTAEIGGPLAGSLLAWIDKEMPGGQSREEWKAEAEGNKILGTARPIPMDGICVRIGTMRCHSQGVCIKLRRDVPVDEIESIIAGSNPWARVIPNTKDATLKCLTPAAVSGTLNVPVGRIHKLRMGPEYLAAFTVGDQLLWGAAEPLRRMLRLLRDQAA
jgi:aspartate-semialdehyde dehydrogenase